MTTQQQQHAFTDIPIRRKDPIILVAVHLTEELIGDDDPFMPCLHLEAWKNETVVCCSKPTEDTCPVCGKPTCCLHQSSKVSFFSHGKAQWVCNACEQLPREDLEAIHTLRMTLNGW